MSVLFFDATADDVRGSVPRSPRVRDGRAWRARPLVGAARRRLHPFRFRQTSCAWSSIRVVAGRGLLERRHQLALPVRAGARLVARAGWAQLDALGCGGSLRVRVWRVARAAALLS